MTDQPVGAHRPAHAGAADGPLALLGNPDLLGRPLLALFCSRRCPGSVILKTYDAAKALRAAGIAVIGGFQTPVERDCLAILLRGDQPVVICPARSLAGMRLAGPIKAGVQAGRALLVSPFAARHRRATAALAEQRNQFVAALARWAFLPHAAAGSKTEALARALLAAGKPVFTVDDAENAGLLALGARPLDVAALR